jgi:hypothetical protein
MVLEMAARSRRQERYCSLEAWLCCAIEDGEAELQAEAPQ